jgi:hypothetical protein
VVDDHVHNLPSMRAVGYARTERLKTVWACLDLGVARAVHHVGCFKLGIHQTDLIGVDRRPWSAAVPLLDLGRVVGSNVGVRCKNGHLPEGAKIVKTLFRSRCK